MLTYYYWNHPEESQYPRFPLAHLLFVEHHIGDLQPDPFVTAMPLVLQLSEKYDIEPSALKEHIPALAIAFIPVSS